jgi:hypothetical protein
MFGKRELLERKLHENCTTATTTASRLRRPRAPSPALLVALLALFLSVGGTALASLIITSNSQVAAHTIAGAKAGSGVNQNVIPGSLAGSDLANGTLTGTQIATGYKDGLATTPPTRQPRATTRGSPKESSAPARTAHPPIASSKALCRSRFTSTRKRSTASC